VEAADNLIEHLDELRRYLHSQPSNQVRDVNLLQIMGKVATQIKYLFLDR
jgi:hypothetical protein